MTTAAQRSRIISEVPPPAWGPRAGRSLATLAGYLLVLVALLLATPALGLVLLIGIAAATGGAIEAVAVLALIALAVGAFLLLRLGLRIARGRRHLVLFLRRFGFDDASSTLTVAASGAMGRRWRLVTLDDSEIEAVGSHQAARWSWGLGRLAALVLLLAAVAAAGYWWWGGDVDRLLSGIFDSAVESGEASGQNAFEVIAGAIIVTIAVGAVLLALVLILAVAGISALGVASYGLWQGNRAVQRAERAKTFAVSDAGDVDPLVDRIRGHARQIQAPRLIVVRVHDRIWRRVVHELAEEASVALVDVSDPTEHLLWEITLLRSEVNAHLLAVGRRDRVEALLEAADGTAARVRDALSGEDILVYEAGGSERGARRFARHLASALELERR